MTDLTLAVFADLHYKQGMYASAVADLQAILDRAAACRADLVLHAGDLCNDYPGSSEVTALYLQNPHGLSVYGCYGNHELETKGTAMSFVTPHLTNREVVWGTPDGKMGDGSIGHYHFDRNGYRVIVTDTNYSLNEKGEWEHNRTGSYGAPAGNLRGHSLGPDQLLWLERTLTEAAHLRLRCIVVSHATFGPWRHPSPDAEAVRALFAKVNGTAPRTVIMAINGHYHTDGLSVEDGVIYFDVNAVRNAWWASTPHGRYGETAPTFPFVAYDDGGAPLGAATRRPLSSLSQGSRTLFTDAPLSAIVRIGNDTVEIEGTDARWIADLAPDTDRPEVIPCIRSRKIKLGASR